MRLLAELPLDREAEGRFTVFSDEGAILYGPVRCRGEADDTEERRHGTSDDDAIHQHGDHPFGGYRVIAVEQNKTPARSYGPFFLRLVPLNGEALTAWHAGRRGLGIHGGDLGDGTVLRPTYGCLRADNETMEAVAKLVKADFAAGRAVLYDCRPLMP